MYVCKIHNKLKLCYYATKNETHKAIYFYNNTYNYYVCNIWYNKQKSRF